ncbi:hypothetical protein S245_043218, partial [Arachis hypogaea]
EINEEALSKLYLLLLHAHYWQLQDRNVNIFLQHCTRCILERILRKPETDAFSEELNHI